MEIRPESSQVHQDAKWLISTQQRDVPARHQIDSTGTDALGERPLTLICSFTSVQGCDFMS